MLGIGHKSGGTAFVHAHEWSSSQGRIYHMRDKPQKPIDDPGQTYEGRLRLTSPTVPWIKHNGTVDLHPGDGEERRNTAWHGTP